MDHSKFVGRQRTRRRFRVRKRLRGTPARPRLSVKRTHKHFYGQLIDDQSGKTLLSVSTLDKEVVADQKHRGNKDAAAAVGRALGAKAAAAGVQAVCFDRGQYKYHGRVAAMADAVREAGVAL